MNRFYGGATATNNMVSPVNNGYGSYMRPANSGYSPNSGSYYPGGMPMQGNQSMWPQQTMTQSVQPQQAMIPNQTNIIWVASDDEISRYPTGKGWQQWFGNKNDPILYVRDTDANGVIQPIVKLRYEVIEDTTPQNDAVAAPANPALDYDGPSREEFNELIKSVNSILSKLDEIMK